MHPTTPPAFSAAAQSPSTPELSPSRIYSSLHFERDYEMRQAGAQMTGKFVGPMPVSQFLEEFLPVASTPLPWNTSSETTFRNVSQQNNEPAMYIALIHALQPFCDNLELVDTHAHADPHSHRLKPDIVAYTKYCDRRSVTDFANIELHMEIKFSERDDGFQDWKPGDEHSFERDNELGMDTRGQIASYAAAHLSSQFRTFVYSILICGHGDETRARILRWDRSGAVVTKGFRLHSKRLADFFWRYSHLSPEARGLDVSVSPASASDAMAARAELGISEDKPLVQITAVNADDDGTVMRYIVAKPPVSFDISATGRSTRGFVAYEPTRGAVVYLKDTWRRDVDGISKEGDIYATLQSHSIPHVARCLLSGDVLNHGTRAQDFVSEAWACDIDRRELVRHRHYRLVLDVVGGALHSFRSTRELVVAVGDAFEAHKLTYEKAGILHRDISVGNILIDRGGHGLLIDWDLCKRMNGQETAGQEERVGTWQFMATRLLKAEENERIQHVLQDDLESFVHVLSWVALRFIPHDLSAPRLSSILSWFDDAYVDKNGRMQGGMWKKPSSFQGVDSISQLVAPHIPRFQTLLRDLTEACSVRYAAPPTEGMMDDYRYLLQWAQAHNPDFMDLLSKCEVAIYLQRMERMRNSDWMLRTLKDAVADSEAGNWPNEDGAVVNKV